MLRSEQFPGKIWFEWKGQPFASISVEEFKKAISTPKIEECPRCRRKDRY